MITMGRVLTIAIVIPSIAAIGAFGYSKSQVPANDKSQSSAAQTVRSKRLSIIATTENDSNGNLILRWSLKNISRTDVDLLDSSILQDYRITLTDDRGNTARLKEKGQQALNASYFSSRRLLRLSPGKEIKKEIDLSEYFKLESNTTYTVRVSRRLLSQDRKTFEEARSNTINFKSAKENN
jgi:hypothetical protein